MHHETAIQSSPERHTLLTRCAFWGAIASTVAWGLAYAVISEASATATARADTAYFPAQFPAPQGEPCAPIETF